MNNILLKLENVNKSFDKRTILSEVSITVETGKIIGIVGPNGSGKTTLLNLVMGLIKPDSGTITFSTTDMTAAAVSRKGFFDTMTVEHNLAMYAYLKNLPETEVERVLSLFDIDFKHLNFNKLSAGMKQRVALANAFMGKYKLLLLDEPTNHLDIDSIFLLRNAIEERANSGSSFILTSHILTELEKQCHAITFLFKGKLTHTYTKQELETKFSNLEEAYLTLSQL